MAYRFWGSFVVAASLGTLLTINAVVNRRQSLRVEEAQTAVAHTYIVEGELAQTLATLVDAETGQRGFLITGNERYLEPYGAALSTLETHLQRLESLTADNGDQQRELRRARELVSAKLAELDQTIAVRRQVGFDAASRIVLTDRGKRNMDELRAVLDEMKSREAALLDQRLAESRKSAQTARWSALGSTTFALVAVAVIWLGYRRSMIEREMSAQAVAEERERLQVTLLGIGDGVIAIDASGRITFMNPVSEALTGWRQPEAVGKQVTDVFRIVNEDTRQRVQNPLALVLSEVTIQGLANHTILIARDGTERPIDDSAAPLRDVAGRVVGGVLIFRDVSQRRADDRRLREALDRAEESTRLAEARQRELEEALNVKNQFLAAVSHELRTPINSIVGWATMLQQGTMRSERAGAGIASIERNAQALAHLIEDLLESSRLLTGKMSLTTEDVVLDRVIGAAVDAIQLTADNKNVALDVHADVVPNVRGDADRLKQVFWNILGNAIKFTPPGGRVNVRITREQEFVAVSVTDTGEGIEPAFLAHVFDNFRQADSRSRGGLGLGLAIARQVVELHGGTIHASSDGANQGATFIVRLPAVPAVI